MIRLSHNAVVSSISVPLDLFWYFRIVHLSTRGGERRRTRRRGRGWGGKRHVELRQRKFKTLGHHVSRYKLGPGSSWRQIWFLRYGTAEELAPFNRNKHIMNEALKHEEHVKQFVWVLSSVLDNILFVLDNILFRGLQFAVVHKRM